VEERRAGCQFRHILSLLIAEVLYQSKRVKKIPPGSGPHQRIYVMIAQKLFQNLGNMIPDLDFLLILDPGSRGQKGRGSWTPDPGFVSVSGSATLGSKPPQGILWRIGFHEM
jgi:hypothetical protein